jgi:hypothetical protein
MLNKSLSAAGIDAKIIEVEVDVSGIKPTKITSTRSVFPTRLVREGRDRVRAALKNCGYRTRDHAHLLIRVPANHSIGDIARLIKANSYEVGPRALARTPSFCMTNRLRLLHHQRVGTRSGSGPTNRSITRRSRFNEEVLVFLKKNGITVDEKYLWD